MIGKISDKTEPVKSIIIIVRRFTDGEAAMNRMLSYAKGFGEAGYNVELLFCITRPDKARFKGGYKNVKIHYLWDDQPHWIARRKGLSYLVSMLQLVRRIGRRDTVFMYFRELPLFYVVSLLTKNLFCETTEHPFYRGKSSVAGRMNFRLGLAFIRRIKGLFVITRSLREYYIGQGVSADKIEIINMFVDTDRFGSTCEAEEPYVAYCGTVSKYKDGVDCLIRAFSRFLRVFPSYKLYIIGAAESEKVSAELGELALGEGVSDAMRLTGKVPADRMPGLLSGARMLALARPDNLQARNGFPTKLGEYLATGKPVVVTRVGEIGDYLQDGVNALLCEPGDPEAFAEKMVWFAAHPDQAARIGAAGRKVAYTEFSYRTQTARALAFIESKIGTE